MPSEQRNQELASRHLLWIAASRAPAGVPEAPGSTHRSGRGRHQLGRDPATIQATLHRRHLSAAYQAKDTTASARARRPRCCCRRRRFLRPAPAKHMETAHALPTTTLPAPSIPAANTRTTRVHGYLFIFRGVDKLGLFDRTCIRQGDRERCSIQWLDGPRRRGGLVDDLVVGRLRGA